MSLNPLELKFYDRQMRLPEVGPQGQEKLKNASVLLIGLGGLGSPAALYLAAAGVGRLGVVEFDRVDVTNLHRQILYSVVQVEQAKIECGAERLRALNPHIKIEKHAKRFSLENGRELVRQYDLVVDGADNFATRYLVNDSCVLEGKPLVSASILGFEGQLSVFNYKGGPCYRCLYPEPPKAETVPSCAEAGVLGALPGVMGSLQACEALKILLGIGEPASARLLHFDALAMAFNDLKIYRCKDCAICGDHPSIFELESLDESCLFEEPNQVAEISPEELKSTLEHSADKIVLIDVREADERAIAKIEPSLHIPLAQLLNDSSSVPKNKTLVVYCQGGGRSLKAANALAARGFSPVLSLRGGMRSF